MNLKQLIKQRVGNQKIKTLKRIKVGRVISFIAALPLMTSWMFVFSIPMCMTLSPTLWVKDKIKYYNDGRRLR